MVRKEKGRAMVVVRKGGSRNSVVVRKGGSGKEGKRKQKVAVVVVRKERGSRKLQW